MSVTIQELTLKDYDEVRALWLDSEGIDLTAADSRKSIARFLDRNPGLSFVARVEGELVGAVLCGHDGRRGYIDHLAVKTSHRRQGIGRLLASRCIYQLIQNRIQKWHLFVREDNLDAIKFWGKLGWQERVELISMSNPNANGPGE